MIPCLNLEQIYVLFYRGGCTANRDEGKHTNPWARCLCRYSPPYIKKFFELYVETEGSGKISWIVREQDSQGVGGAGK